MTERERYSVVLHLIALCVGLLVGCGWIYRVVISTDILLEPDFRMTIISVTGFLCVVTCSHYDCIRGYIIGGAGHQKGTTGID
jgi:hypothetical protein